MRQTMRLLRHSTLVTLFTRKNCSLCENAKSVIKNLTKKKNFDYHQVDIMASNQQRWRLLYEFDAPVVRFAFTSQKLGAKSSQKLHVQRIPYASSKSDFNTEARKLMHCFDERQVEKLIEEAEGDP